MKKESTRPLLVGIVERWRALEQAAFRNLPQVDSPEWEVNQAKAEWATTTRELTQAETLLWLADQQWEREERALSVSRDIEASLVEPPALPPPPSTSKGV